MHVVLLGDSVLDNKAYVQANESDVCTQLASSLGDTHRATLGAVDGSMTVNVADQLVKIPSDATHLVLSIGGNNIIDQLAYADAPASTTTESMIILSALLEQFRKLYHENLQDILKLGLPTIVCNMHNPPFEDDTILTVAVTALQAFNDCICQEVTQAGLPLIEMRSVCSDETDFADVIALSASGGQKLAQAIKQVLDTHDFSIKRTQIYT